tara:strand:+ start:197 stop:445 length:249 start_codon:yes stop_codon:yes gene_type:complete
MNFQKNLKIWGSGSNFHILAFWAQNTKIRIILVKMTGGRWLRARWKRIFGQFRKFRTCLINTLPTIAQTPSNRQLNPNYYSL